MGSYRIVPFHPGLLRGIAELRRSLFGRTLSCNIAYFEWMYGQNPFIEEPPLFIALHRGVPVGMRGTLGTRWVSRLFHREHTLPSFTDTGIHSSHRDRGLYEELTSRALDEYAARGYSHVLNMTPSPQNFLASTLSSGGFSSVGEHGTLIRSDSRRKLANTHRAIRALHRRFPRSRIEETIRGRWAKHRLDGTAPGARQVLQTNGISGAFEAHPSIGEMADLVSHLADSDERIRHVRDREYFAWRYRNPLAYHRFLCARKEGSLVGYAVLQSPVSGGPIDIADLQWADEATFHALLDVITLSIRGSVRIWSSTFAEPLTSVLVNHQFGRPQGNKFAERFIMRPLRDDADRWLVEGADLRRLESWDLRAADATTY